MCALGEPVLSRGGLGLFLFFCRPISPPRRAYFNQYYFAPLRPKEEQALCFEALAESLDKSYPASRSGAKGKALHKERNAMQKGTKEEITKMAEHARKGCCSPSQHLHKCLFSTKGPLCAVEK